MSNKFLLLASFISITVANACKAQNHNDNDGYKLVWSDEFNKDGAPDTSTWRFEEGFVRNHEEQWYQKENATCKNGNLIIEIRKDTTPNPTYNAESNNWKTSRKTKGYTSSSLNTAGRKSWLYGRFVMRAKFDADDGLWPAFWTLGENGQWPSNGEIDIMEYYKKNLLANIACGTEKQYVAKWFSNKRPLSSFKGKSWNKKFHIWRMDWDENSIKLYVDDTLMNSVPLSKLVNPDGTNPFKQKQYILLDLALGGDNGGPINGTKFPKSFVIDYVRVYQKD